MDTKAAKEEQEERNPSEILKECRQEIALSQTIFQESVAEVTNARKNNSTRQQDFKAVQVELVDLKGKTKNEVVDYRAKCSSGNSVNSMRTYKTSFQSCSEQVPLTRRSPEVAR